MIRSAQGHIRVCSQIKLSGSSDIWIDHVGLFDVNGFAATFFAAVISVRIDIYDSSGSGAAGNNILKFFNIEEFTAQRTMHKLKSHFESASGN